MEGGDRKFYVKAITNWNEDPLYHLYILLSSNQNQWQKCIYEKRWNESMDFWSHWTSESIRALSSLNKKKIFRLYQVISVTLPPSRLLALSLVIIFISFSIISKIHQLDMLYMITKRYVAWLWFPCKGKRGKRRLFKYIENDSATIKLCVHMKSSRRLWFFSAWFGKEELKMIKICSTTFSTLFICSNYVWNSEPLSTSYLIHYPFSLDALFFVCEFCFMLRLGRKSPLSGKLFFYHWCENLSRRSFITYE